MPFLDKSAKSIQVALKTCVLLHFLLESGFSKIFRHLLTKNSFCVKSALRIELTFENWVLLHFELEPGFCHSMKQVFENLLFCA